MIYLVDIFKALLTPLLAIIAAYIAYKQYSLAKHKNDVEVFDRRLNIYKSTLNLIRNIESNNKVNLAMYNAWELQIFEAELLFDNVVMEHLAVINDLVSELSYLEEKREWEDDCKEADTTSLHSDVFNDLTAMTGTTKTVFRPYFSIIKSRHKISRKSSYKDIVNQREKEINNINKKAIEAASNDDLPF